MSEVMQELTVRGETVERIFTNFFDRKYLVNRRYQRKLIWTLEEKQNFIDSISKGFPVPIILLAEPVKNSAGSLEIIDGMQRMDAINSFIANAFPVNGEYFDLNTVAITKDILDGGIIEQKLPVMDRKKCVYIASYLVPLSIYEFTEEESVDEVFRRINSGGRQLSRQELRVAGATGSFADCVRTISSDLRGDSSPMETLVLNDMQKISITNRDLDYGIAADDVFWVRNGILSKDHLRQSRDEENVADLLAYMVSEQPVASRSELLDDYFGTFSGKSGANHERYENMDQAIRKRSQELIINDFQRTHDAILLTLKQSGQTFSQLLFPTVNPNPLPRYYQAVFLAFHRLIVEQSKVVSKRQALVAALSGKGGDIVIQEGGRWGAERRSTTVNAVVGMIQDCFEPDQNTDPAQVHWVTRLENLLSYSKTEQSAYDFKQGFMTLSNEPKFDNASFEKIMKTCVGIANIGRGQKGYVLVGVAETSETALRVEQIFNEHALQHEGFYLVGVEHEARHQGKNLDQLFQLITDKIGGSAVSNPLKQYLNSNLKLVRYFDKTIFVFETLGQDEPSLYGDTYLSRKGTQLFEVAAKDFSALFSRFQ